MPLTYTLPRRRKVTKRVGADRQQREWPRHRRFVRSHHCCVPACFEGPVVFAHFRTAANSGTGMKPHDRYGISLCDAHHKEQHQIGQAAFEKKYGISMEDLADAFTRRTTDMAMRESLKGNDDVE